MLPPCLVLPLTHAAPDSCCPLTRAAPGKAGCSLDPDSPYACFHFSACFRVEEEEGAVDMRIQVTIEAHARKVVSIDKDAESMSRMSKATG